MTIYEQLIATGDYVSHGDEPNISLKMSKVNGPTSIKIEEFNYICKLIENNNLKRGYEIATGFGISALAAGIAFKKTGGKIVTLDSYIEEKTESDHAYRSFSKTLYENAEGYKSVQNLIKMFSLENVIVPRVGWSPDDVETILTQEFINLEQEKLDFVFIDGGHFVEAVERDIKSVKNYVGPGTKILLHDVFEGVFTVGFPDLVKRLLGKEYKIVVPYPIGFNMAIVEL